MVTNATATVFLMSVPSVDGELQNATPVLRVVHTVIGLALQQVLLLVNGVNEVCLTLNTISNLTLTQRCILRLVLTSTQGIEVHNGHC